MLKKHLQTAYIPVVRHTFHSKTETRRLSQADADKSNENTKEAFPITKVLKETRL